MARKVDHEERRREIAEKAMRLFSQVGYENVSLIMIAASAGVSRTVLYRYFCSKREVMDAAILTVTSAIERECVEIIANREPAISRLEKVCHAVVEPHSAGGRRPARDPSSRHCHQPSAPGERIQKTFYLRSVG